MKTRISLFLIVCAPFCAMSQENRLPSTGDSAYGYTVHQPLQMKLGARGCFDFYLGFISELITEDGQELDYLDHFTMRDQSYKKTLPWEVVPGRRMGKGPIGSSRGGIKGQVERYRYITSTTKDTITLYVSFQKSGAPKIPVGLKQRPRKTSFLPAEKLLFNRPDEKQG